MHIVEKSFDDLLRKTLLRIQAEGIEIDPTKGKSKELFGVILELTNPRARISHSENRGTIYSCLGEFLWYLAKSNDLDFVQYYIKDYWKFSDDGKTLFGGYGPRIFGPAGLDQYTRVRTLLAENPSSRKAVIQIIKPQDLFTSSKDVPCTCSLQFAVRNDKLHMFTSMRSNDAMIGMPHDFFAFTMLQEILACDLSLEVGTYKHAVGSLHIYEKDLPKVEAYLAEGYQGNIPMPAMPQLNLHDAIDEVIKYEANVRGGGLDPLPTLDPYWLDLLRLLEIHAVNRTDLSYVQKLKKWSELKDAMHSKVYEYHIRKKKPKEDKTKEPA